MQQNRTSVGQPSPIPEPLAKWIQAHDARTSGPETALLPGGKGQRNFVLVTAPLSVLQFRDHRFNPRTPNEGKVKELAASIQSLSLLTPLTCAFLNLSPPGEEEGGHANTAKSRPITSRSDDSDMDESSPMEQVVLLDGRHRFEALVELANADPEWKRNIRVDLKIYFNLSRSEIYLLATYLNKTRKSLAKGEYFKFIVKIYDEKKSELESKSGKPVTEEYLFQQIEARELTNKNADLSIGRIVGLTAFDPEEGDSWYPMVGVRQQEMIPEEIPEGPGYCPITAGNMATLLGYLCSTSPYSDDGSRRGTEIGNVLTLGVHFRKRILQPVRSYDLATPTTVCCKHWCVSALGYIMKESASELCKGSIKNDEALLSRTEVRWSRILEVISAYWKAMEPQAQMINDFRDTNDIRELKNAWSYQTQREQVLLGLRPAMKDKLPWLKAA